MLISKEIQKLMNQQVGNEMGASLQYTSIASYFTREDLPKLAELFFLQADEERMHAMKFVHYINEAGGSLVIPDVKGPKSDFASAEEAVKLSLEWELEVTRQINAIMDQAIKESDHIAQNFLRWFVTEQLEEVSTMNTLLRTVQRAGSNLLLVEDFLARHPLGAAAEAGATGAAGEAA